MGLIFFWSPALPYASHRGQKGTLFPVPAWIMRQDYIVYIIMFIHLKGRGHPMFIHCSGYTLFRAYLPMFIRHIGYTFHCD